jgi:hypothetical protein
MIEPCELLQQPENAYDDGRWDDVDWSPYEGFASFIPTEVFTTLMYVRNQIVLLVTGNRFGKTKYFGRKIVYGLMGKSPIPYHNMTPDCPYRVWRVSAVTLPTDKQHEVRNTVYPTIKGQLPATMIATDKRGEALDITHRDTTITVLPSLGGKPAYLEFVSYGQATLSQAGVDRFGVNIDEPCPYGFYEESIARLTLSNGQLLSGFTPVEADWMFGELYERAKIIVRTRAVRDYMKKRLGQMVPAVEMKESSADICVIQAASDDNPVFQILVNNKLKDIKEGRISKEDFPYETVTDYLDAKYMYDDADTVAMRRFGIFRRITGAVFTQYQAPIHWIDEYKYFTNGEVPHEWYHVRLCDYHQHVPWAISFLALSLDNECFAYEEMNPDPHMTITVDVCKEIAQRSRDYKYQFNLMDPLANETQSNTNKTVFDDFNRHFREMKREGIGTGGHWEPWDTKGKVGLNRVRERLINSLKCGKPFNNLQMVEGKEVRLPTLWVFSKCKQTAASLKLWRQETWATQEDQVTKEEKDKAEQKWSHFNKCLECAMKDIRFRGKAYEYRSSRERAARDREEEDRHVKRYFQGRR